MEADLKKRLYEEFVSNHKQTTILRSQLMNDLNNPPFERACDLKEAKAQEIWIDYLRGLNDLAEEYVLQRLENLHLVEVWPSIFNDVELAYREISDLAVRLRNRIYSLIKEMAQADFRELCNRKDEIIQEAKSINSEDEIYSYEKDFIKILHDHLLGQYFDHETEKRVPSEKQRVLTIDGLKPEKD